MLGRPGTAAVAVKVIYSASSTLRLLEVVYELGGGMSEIPLRIRGPMGGRMLRGSRADRVGRLRRSTGRADYWLLAVVFAGAGVAGGGGAKVVTLPICTMMGEG